MPWYAYQSGGWQIAVDAVNQKDAAQHIKRHAAGAEFQGEFNPPRMASGNWSSATAMTTARRQEEISASLERERQAWIAAGRPGAWWDTPNLNR